METTDIWYKDAHDALRIETGEENPEIWSLWFGNPFNNKTRISSEISRREREKGGREGGRERRREGENCNQYVSSTFLVLQEEQLIKTHLKRCCKESRF